MTRDRKYLERAIEILHKSIIDMERSRPMQNYQSYFAQLEGYLQGGIEVEKWKEEAWATPK